MLRCTRCGASFTEAENDDTACCFHSGDLCDYNSARRVEHSEGRGGAPGDYWDCCMAQVDQHGYAKGCVLGRHTTGRAD
jgi:hypothetical protein